MPGAYANELLSYPPDTRLLILNADVFGIYDDARPAASF